MTEIKKSREVPYTLAQMHSLVTTLGLYPEFLPWVKEVKIVSQDKTKISANLHAEKWNINFAFNMIYLIQPNNVIEIRLRSGGPFRHIAGFWKFDTLKNKGTKLTFELQLEFASPWMRWTLLPFIKRECTLLLKNFVARAEKLYDRNFRI